MYDLNDNRVNELIGVYKGQLSSGNLNQYRGIKRAILNNLDKTMSDENRKKFSELLSKFEGVEPTDVTEDDKPFDLVVGQKWVQLRTSALRRGKDFNLTFGDVKKLMSRKTCYYTGKPFTDQKMYTRTIDRLDPNQGYVKGNVFPVHHAANQIKSTWEGNTGKVIADCMVEVGVTYTTKLLVKLTELGFKGS